MNTIDSRTVYEDLVEKIRGIDTKYLTDDVDDSPKMKIIEKQKVYHWVRLFITEELTDLKEGDDFEICYEKSKEKLLSKFIAFGKKNLNKDLDQQIINYEHEDDKKVLILMVDSDYLTSDEIPFIRTLFKTSSYYQFQVYKRTDLTFTNKRNNQLVKYIDCNF